MHIKNITLILALIVAVAAQRVESSEPKTRKELYQEVSKLIANEAGITPDLAPLIAPLIIGYAQTKGGPREYIVNPKTWTLQEVNLKL